MNQLQIGIHRKKENKKYYVFQFLFTIAFSLAMSASIIGYINSSYLKQYINAKYVGLVFTLAYFVAFFCISYFSRIINKLGRTKTFVILLIIQALALLSFAWVPFVPVVLFSFVVLIVGANLLWITYDIHLEHFTLKRETGRIRGTSLTIINVAWLISPALAGYLVNSFGFSIIYTISAILLLPIIGLAFFVRDGASKRIPQRSSKIIIKKIFRSIPLRSIFFLVFVLQVFYSWMVIYTPLYLLSLGLGWDTIGTIFTVMLLPFVLLQFPAGYLADKYWGETEMLSLGLIIMSVASFVLFFVTSVWALALTLLFTRVGASLIEELSDTYFFKHVHENETELINYYRDIRPLAYVISPIVASIIIFFLPIKFLFIILSLFILTGLAFSLTMPDTK